MTQLIVDKNNLLRLFLQVQAFLYTRWALASCYFQDGLYSRSDSICRCFGGPWPGMNPLECNFQSPQTVAARSGSERSGADILADIVSIKRECGQIERWSERARADLKSSFARSCPCTHWRSSGHLVTNMSVGERFGGKQPWSGLSERAGACEDSDW